MSRTVQLRSVVWFTTGMAIMLIATLLVTQAWQADAAPGDNDSTFVPTTPCRLFDYRPAPRTVGPRSAPLGSGETFTQQVTGNNGNCTGPLAIPAGTVAVALNVTAVSPTAQSNLRVFPANVATVPTVSNLNFSAGQQPVPNKVDVKLSPGGAIKLFNAAGSVSVIGDVVGYYTKTSLTELDDRLTALEAAQPFAVTATSPNFLNLSATTTNYLGVEVTAPVAGHVTVNYSMYIYNGTGGGVSKCAPYSAAETLPDIIGATDPGVGYWKSASTTPGNEGSVSGTRQFTIGEGATVTYSLACQINGGTGAIGGPTITAIFTPTP